MLDNEVIMQLDINGRNYDVADADSTRPLLWVLRDELGLTGTKFGCGAGICGSCTVHLGGRVARACVTPLSAVQGQAIRTIEGLAASGLHPVQEAFIEAQVPQCAWCMSGQVMTAAAFLDDNPQPSEQEIVDAMSNNYCRCGCYVRIKEAVVLAAEKLEVSS